MDPRSEYVGVDGCKAGWFFVAFDAAGAFELGIEPNMTELWRNHQGAARILVDIPIGMRERGTEERLCDLQARRLLGPGRASSVFPCPARGALACATYEESSKLNAELTARRLSRQSWAIAPKILEVDQFLLSHPAAARVVQEVHPETLFFRLNGDRPTSFSKKKREGVRERVGILNLFGAPADEVLRTALGRYPRKALGADDVLDALASAVVGRRFAGSSLTTLPVTPEVDDRGLPMQMVIPTLSG